VIVRIAALFVIPSNKKGGRELAQEKVEFPITGTVISVNVKVGDEVKEGDVLCLLESMKMENPILAPVNGKVTGINLSSGQVVQAGELVAVIEY
jgi:biotin carboxyl carrier protein